MSATTITDARERVVRQAPEAHATRDDAVAAGARVRLISEYTIEQQRVLRALIAQGPAR